MSDAEACHRRIAAAVELTWEWDPRFSMALAVFGFERVEEVESALASALPHRWMAHDIRNAPQRTRDVAEDMGGLRAAQILFTTADSHATMAVCAWWPWGNGTRYSIRMGCDAGSDIALQARLADELRGWYGL